MSHVTDIILIASGIDGRKRGKLNGEKLSDYLIDRYGAGLVRTDQHAGGNKGMQCDVWMSAINFMNIDEFIDEFDKIDWDLPEMVMLMIKDEHDDLFTTHYPQHG